MSVRPVTAFQRDTVPASRSRYAVSTEAMATIVIFGVTGDLAKRKLIPAIYNLWSQNFLPERIAVVGVARKEKSDNLLREELCEALKEFSRTGHGTSDTCDPFVGNLFYHQLDFANHDGYGGLADRLADIERQRNVSSNRLFYLATDPEFFAPIVEDLQRAALVYPMGDTHWSRVVIEKPFGHDLLSAKALNAQLRSVLSEDQIYRIDHYLGKETVQNIMAFRFGNAIFEPLFNHHFVDHVQVTVAETVGMEGRRGGFYDKTGALRDVIQNHGLQLLSLMAMEPPARFSAKEIRDEKLKVLDSISLPDQPVTQWAVRGQYTEGQGEPGYLCEQGVSPDSQSETYAALRLHVDNWRWAEMPFYIRTGKKLKARVTEIAIQFKQPPTHYFKNLGLPVPPANQLVFRIQPNEGISLTFGAKPPGMAFEIAPVKMEFDYGDTFVGDLPEAYERLLLDALRGDSTLFMRADEIESAWRIVTNVTAAWESAAPPELYRPGTWGPAGADRIFTGEHGKWRTPAP